MKNKIFGMLICLLFASCAQVTMKPKGLAKFNHQANYDETQTLWLWGLVAADPIDVKEICKDKEVLQMQTRRTFLNGFLQVITLGIYMPRTAKVWCENS